MSETNDDEAPPQLYDDRRFGRHIRSLRRARGMTQEVLAERGGLSADTIRRLERGAFSPSLDTLRKLAEGLSLHLSTLFSGFETVERDVPREIVDALWYMSAREHEMLLRMVHAFLQLLRSGRTSDSD